LAITKIEQPTYWSSFCRKLINLLMFTFSLMTINAENFGVCHRHTSDAMRKHHQIFIRSLKDDSCHIKVCCRKLGLNRLKLLVLRVPVVTIGTVQYLFFNWIVHLLWPTELVDSFLFSLLTSGLKITHFNKMTNSSGWDQSS
jgi:hypothetical protein